MFEARAATNDLIINFTDQSDSVECQDIESKVTPSNVSCQIVLSESKT